MTKNKWKRNLEASFVSIELFWFLFFVLIFFPYLFFSKDPFKFSLGRFGSKVETKKFKLALHFLLHRLHFLWSDCKNLQKPNLSSP